jgi:hypothetical protein
LSDCSIEDCVSEPPEECSDICVTASPINRMGDPISELQLAYLSLAPQPSRRRNRDYCSQTDDNVDGNDYSGACAAHDQCYSRGSSTDRIECDRQLADSIRRTCVEAGRTVVYCVSVSATYYIGVRALGWIYYDGNGKRWF